MARAVIRVSFVGFSGTVLLWNCWCTWKTTQTVKALLSTQRPSSVSARSNTAESRIDVNDKQNPITLQKNASNSIIRPRLFSQSSGSNSNRRLSARKEINKSKRTMIATAVSCLLFSFSTLFAMMSNIMTLSQVGLNDDTPEHRLDKRVRDAGRPYRYFSALFQLSGYVCLCLVCFERYRIVFSDSAFALPAGTIRFVRCLIGSTAMLILLTVVSAYWVGSVVTLSLAIGPIILYPSISVWTGWKFQRTSIRIAKTVECCEKTDALLNGSMRLCLVIWVAVLSTGIMSMSFIVYSIKETTVTTVLFYVLYYMDQSINCLCLLMTFASRKNIYLLFLGPLHHWCISWMMNRYSKAVSHPVANNSDTN